MCTFHMYCEFAVKEEEFYPEMYVLYYVWSSMVELTTMCIWSVAHIAGFGKRQ